MKGRIEIFNPEEKSKPRIVFEVESIDEGVVLDAMAKFTEWVKLIEGAKK